MLTETSRTQNSCNINCTQFLTAKRRIQLGHWNLNGVMSKQFGNKLELDEVLNTINNYDIFGVSETHLLPFNGKQMEGFKDFHSYRNPGRRINYGSGGLSIYIKSGIMAGISIIHGET